MWALMRSRMTPSVYRHSGGSGLRPKPAGFLVLPPPSRGVNTPTRSTGHHFRVNSPQHILLDLKMCIQGQYVFISEYISVACTVQTHQGSRLLQGQHVSGGLSDPWFLVCVPTSLFLSLLLGLLVIVRIVEECWIC